MQARVATVTRNRPLFSHPNYSIHVKSEHMKSMIPPFGQVAMLALSLLAANLLGACSLMEDDLPACPQGLDLHFKYDYNLERADMFTDHVGGVTVYLFDAEGRYLTEQSVANTRTAQPLRDHNYRMHFDVAPGQYTYTAIAWQKPYAECLLAPGAKFRLTPPQAGGTQRDLSVTLDHIAAIADTAVVVNAGQPLDTLWHGYRTAPLTVVADEVTTDTVALVRDTKHVSVALRNVDEAENTDIADYDILIIDHNPTIGWDNSVDESAMLCYTPYRSWNTIDKSTDRQTKAETAGQRGQIAHADLMTSRLIDHGTDYRADGVLTVRNRRTGVEVIRVNLPDLLSRLRGSADLGMSAQEFLDRGYDYKLTFFLRGDRWAYVNVEISTLSWEVRHQAEDIEP